MSNDRSLNAVALRAEKISVVHIPSAQVIRIIGMEIADNRAVLRGFRK